MTKDDALKLALEALEEAHYKHEHRQDATKRGQAITAIKEALEQPSDSVEQEPVNIVLDSWDAWASSTEYDNQNHDLLSALKDIREALAEPEKEPECVAVINVFGNDWRLEQLSLPVGKHRLYAQQYTYTAPPRREWVGLTGDDMDNITDTALGENHAMWLTEAKLKELNT